MYSFLGNNEIDDLMKKYDAIDKATGSSVDEQADGRLPRRLRRFDRGDHLLERHFGAV